MISQKELKARYKYDPETGIFTYNINAGKFKIGEVAGGLTSDGYIRIRISGKEYRAHRLAFLYMTGKFPVDKVDHKNRIRTDNRWDNIIEVTSLENSKNRNINTNNTSGVTGIYRSSNKWRVRIMVNGETIPLGCFEDFADANIARIEAEMKYGFV